MREQQGGEAGLTGGSHLLDQFGNAGGDVVAFRELRVDEEADFHAKGPGGGLSGWTYHTVVRSSNAETHVSTRRVGH